MTKENNELKVFHEQEVLGKVFKIYGDKDNPLFLAKDVADWIEHNKPSEMIKNVDDDEKIKVLINPSDSIAGVLQTNTEYWFLYEDGIYEVLMQSRKPIAKQFKKKVKEILKDIRQHGVYMTDNLLEQTLTNPQFMIDILTNYQEEKRKRQELEITVEEQKPLVSFAEKCIKTDDSILVRELSKVIQEQGINVGEKKLYKKLREWGLILQNKTEPSQRGMDLELFEVIQRPINTPYGERLEHTTKVTPKGQVYIIEKLNKEMNISK